MAIQPHHNLRDCEWIMAFGVALLQCFESKLSKENLITSMKTVAKVSPNAVRVGGRRKLTESFDRTLTAILALLSEREVVMAADPMIKVQRLIGEYRPEAEAKRRALREEVAAKAAGVSACSVTIYRAAANAPTLQQACDQASVSIAAAEAEDVQIKAELARAQQALVEHRRHHKELVGHLKELESSTQAA